VRRGDPLFEIDPRQFQAALERRAARSPGRRPSSRRPRRTWCASRRWRPDRAISQQELDNALAAEHDAQGGLAVAKATLDQAALNRGWTRVTSPIEGIVGIAKTQVGDLVKHADGDDHRVDRDPIRVTFGSPNASTWTAPSSSTG